MLILISSICHSWLIVGCWLLSFLKGLNAIFHHNFTFFMFSKDFWIIIDVFGSDSKAIPITWIKGVSQMESLKRMWYGSGNLHFVIPVTHPFCHANIVKMCPLKASKCYRFRLRTFYICINAVIIGIANNNIHWMAQKLT